MMNKTHSRQVPGGHSPGHFLFFLVTCSFYCPDTFRADTARFYCPDAGRNIYANY